MFLQNCIDKNERSIKILWLSFSIAWAVFPIIINIMFALFGERKKAHFSLVPYNVIIFTLLYYLVYKKPGTHLLTFLIFWKPFCFTIMPACLFHQFPYTDFKLLNYCNISMDFFIDVGWIFLSLQLRKINIRRQFLLLQKNCINEEQFIRNLWLIFSIAWTVFPPISLVVEESFFIMPNFGEVIVPIFFKVIMLALLYRFAYKNPGTAVLTFLMCLKLTEFLELFFIHFKDLKILNYCSMLIIFFINLGWMFLSLQLRELNTRRQLLLLKNYIDEEQSIRNC